MTADDPVRELERRVDALAARLDLTDERNRADFAAIHALLERVRDDADDHVTRAEFSPVRQLVYGAAAAILMTVLGAVLALVIRGSA